MRFENICYMTSDRLLDIEFLFVDMGGETGWRAYILTDINYQMRSRSRSDNSGTVHRLKEYDANMRSRVNGFLRATRGTDRSEQCIRYVCWSKAIYDLSDMKEVAKTWSEITAYYIRHGGSFETIQPILKAKGIISL